MCDGPVVELESSPVPITDMMNTKPSGCQGCPLQNIGEGFVPDTIRPSSPVVIMGGCPSMDDVKGRMLVGWDGPHRPIYENTVPTPGIDSHGWLLWNILVPQSRLSHTDISHGHIIRCHIPSTVKDDIIQDAALHCQIAHFNPPSHMKLVIALGQLPWAHIQGPLSIHDWRGFLGPACYMNTPVYAVQDPATLWKDPHARFVARLDWKKLPRVLDGSWPLPIPPQCVASPSNVEQFEALLEEALCQKELLVDTEYITDNSLLTHVGVAWNSSSSSLSKMGLGSRLTSPAPTVRGFQIEWVRGAATTVERAIFLKHWTRLCQKVTMGFWNAKADLPILKKNLGIIPQTIEDPMQAHSVLWPGMPHDFEFVASIYGQYPKLKHLSDTDILLYHWGDCIDLVSIWEAIKDEFKKEPACEQKYRRQNLPLIPITLEREEKGIKVNQKRVSEAIPLLEQDKHGCLAIAQAYCGFPMNLGSSTQLKYFLESTEGLHLKNTDQNEIAKQRNKFLVFDAEYEEKKGLSLPYILSRIEQGAHPLLEARVLYAKSTKTLNHYLRPLSGLDRCYPKFNFHTQVTGRHSTTDPPLATFPEHLRDIIMPDPGTVWIGWDWEAQEPRIQWGESGSRVLGQAFTQNIDIHTDFLCRLFGWDFPRDRSNPHTAPGDEAWRRLHDWGGKDDYRRVYAKTVRYELNYDHTEKAWNAQQNAIRMGIKPEIAKKAAQVLLNADPELRQWFRKVMETGKKTKIVRSWGGGRQIYYWMDGFSKVPYNEMRNYPLQAGGADLYNLTIVEMAREVPEAQWVYGMHDSLYFELPVIGWQDLYAHIKRIAIQERQIGGRMIPFPGTFKMIDDTGKVTKL